MKVDFFNNQGIKTLEDELFEKMLCSNSFDIATAFITSDAIELIRQFLNKNKNRKSIGRLITGFYHCFNSQEVLLELQALAKKSKGRLLVSISTNTRFHWKYYYFGSNQGETAYIGSANFTTSGISGAGEIITKISLTGKDKSERQNLKKLFNTELENSIDIQKFPLEEYRQSKSASAKSDSLPASIRNILNAKSKIPFNDSKINKVRAVFMKGYLSNVTQKIIQEKKSKWSNYDYYSCNNKAEYDAALNTDALFLIYKYKGIFSFYLVKIIDSCQIKTPDAEYFIAYKTINTKHGEKGTFREEIKQLGIHYHGKVFKEKTLRQQQTRKLLTLFGYPQLDQE